MLRSHAGMQRVRIYKPPTGVALLEAKRDRSVLLVDLQVIGAKVLKRTNPEKYSKQYEIMESTLKALGLPSLGSAKEERLVLRLKGRIVLAILTYSGDDAIVRTVAFAAFSPGVLAKLVRRLEANGWKKIVMLELKPARSTRQPRYSTFSAGA